MSGVLTALSSFRQGSGSFNLGYSSVGGSSDSWVANYAIMYRAQASASGSMQNAFFYAGNTSTQNIKIAVYTSAAASPGAGDTSVGITGVINSTGGPTWVSGAITGSLTSGNFYWICLFLDSAGGGVQHQHDGTASLYYLSASGYYASPPANLGGVTSNVLEAKVSMYITAQ